MRFARCQRTAPQAVGKTSLALGPTEGVREQALRAYGGQPDAVGRPACKQYRQEVGGCRGLVAAQNSDLGPLPCRRHLLSSGKLNHSLHRSPCCAEEGD